MKKLIVLASLSLGAFAAQNALEAFSQILRNDTFEGLTPEGEDCTVDVYGSSNETLVEIEAYGITRFRITRTAPFTTNVAAREFSTSILSSQGGETETETTLSTRKDGTKLRVAIQRTRRAGGQQWTSVQDCRI